MVIPKAGAQLELMFYKPTSLSLDLKGEALFSFNYRPILILSKDPKVLGVDSTMTALTVVNYNCKGFISLDPLQYISIIFYL